MYLQGRKARLQELLDERQRKRDEQLAKEEAAQERRKTKEAERLAKLMEMDQRRRDQEVKVEQMLLERERAREEAAKEKAKYVTPPPGSGRLMGNRCEICHCVCM